MDMSPRLPHPEQAAFKASVLQSLQESPKRIEPRWLYDAVGAKLFEAITNLDHYYLTRTETALLERHAAAIADALGDDVTIVEPGSGDALKVRPLLDALGRRARAYVPVDIAHEQLDAVSAELDALYPDLDVRGIAADFFRPFAMEPAQNAVIFFAGSTVGNMTPDAAVRLFKMWQEATGADRFLIGFDLVKDEKTLVDAYDDPAGVTAAFEKNLLQRVNRELDGTFDIRKFDYDARFNAARSAVEMRLIASEDQTVDVAGTAIDFREGESIHVEDSRKYTVDSFAAFARSANLTALSTWTDENNYFAVMLLAANKPSD